MAHGKRDAAPSAPSPDLFKTTETIAPRSLQFRQFAGTHEWLNEEIFLLRRVTKINHGLYQSANAVMIFTHRWEIRSRADSTLVAQNPQKNVHPPKDGWHTNGVNVKATWDLVEPPKKPVGPRVMIATPQFIEFDDVDEPWPLGLLLCYIRSRGWAVLDKAANSIVGFDERIYPRCLITHVNGENVARRAETLLPVLNASRAIRDMTFLHSDAWCLRDQGTEMHVLDARNKNPIEYMAQTRDLPLNLTVLAPRPDNASTIPKTTRLDLASEAPMVQRDSVELFDALGKKPQVAPMQVDFAGKRAYRPPERGVLELLKEKEPLRVVVDRLKRNVPLGIGVMHHPGMGWEIDLVLDDGLVATDPNCSLKTGSLIVAVDGYRVKDLQDLASLISRANGPTQFVEVHSFPPGTWPLRKYITEWYPANMDLGITAELDAGIGWRVVKLDTLLRAENFGTQTELQVGSHIVSVNGRDVRHWPVLSPLLTPHPDRVKVLAFLRPEVPVQNVFAHIPKVQTELVPEEFKIFLEDKAYDEEPGGWKVSKVGWDRRAKATATEVMIEPGCVVIGINGRDVRLLQSSIAEMMLQDKGTKDVSYLPAKTFELREEEFPANSRLGVEMQFKANEGWEIVGVDPEGVVANSASTEICIGAMVIAINGQDVRNRNNIARVFDSKNQTRTLQYFLPFEGEGDNLQPNASRTRHMMQRDERLLFSGFSGPLKTLNTSYRLFRLSLLGPTYVSEKPGHAVWIYYQRPFWYFGPSTHGEEYWVRARGPPMEVPANAWHSSYNYLPDITYVPVHRETLGKLLPEWPKQAVAKGFPLHVAALNGVYEQTSKEELVYHKDDKKLFFLADQELWGIANLANEIIAHVSDNNPHFPPRGGWRSADEEFADATIEIRAVPEHESTKNKKPMCWTCIVGKQNIELGLKCVRELVYAGLRNEDVIQRRITSMHVLAPTVALQAVRVPGFDAEYRIMLENLRALHLIFSQLRHLVPMKTKRVADSSGSQQDLNEGEKQNADRTAYATVPLREKKGKRVSGYSFEQAWDEDQNW